MAGFEDLIRGALIKQGNTTPESREKIYASARQALDRMVAENANLDSAIIETQRAKLDDAIKRIESDHADSGTTAKTIESDEKSVPEVEEKQAPEPQAEEKPESTPSASEPVTESPASKPDTTEEPSEPSKAEPTADVPPPDDSAAAASSTDVVEEEVEEEPIPKIELSGPVDKPDGGTKKEAPAEATEKSPTEDLPEKRVQAEPVVEETKTAPEPDKPSSEAPSNPAPITETATSEPKEEPVPKIALRTLTEKPEIETDPPAPPLAEPEPEPKPFTLEPSTPPDVVAPTVAATAAAATLDLSKGTRTAPDLIADPKPQQTVSSTPTARIEPNVDTPTPAPPPIEPPPPNVETEASEPVRLEYEPEAPEIYPQTYTGNALNERKPYAKMLLWTIILVGIGVAIWWAVTFGPALIKAQLDGSVPNPRATLETGSFDPGGGNEDGWVTVFAPDANEDDVVPGTRSIMELQRENGRQVMRMASPDGSPENNLKIRIARNVMESLRGKAATFELVIRSTTAEDQEFVLFCEFSKMGNCGRKRFSAGSNSEPFIFDVLVNDVTLPANENAYLSLNTDFSGKGRALDLYSVRVRTGA